MRCIRFTIPYICKAKQGDRARVIAAKSGRTFVQHYPTAETRENAESLASLIVPHRPDMPMAGPVRLDLTFRFPWRKSDSRKQRQAGSRPKDTKPDWDNLGKQVSDVLEASGFFANDSQIAEVHLVKLFTDSPGIDVVLQELEEAR